MIALMPISAAMGADPYKNPASDVPGSRSLGTNANFAAPGNDSRFTNFYQSLCPVGTVLDYAGATAPDGWFLCYGQLASSVTYTNLYAAIGNSFNVGASTGQFVSGTWNFRIPDCRGRVLAGLDNMGGSAAGVLAALVLGTNLGATNIVVAAHDHSVGAHSHPAGTHTHSYTNLSHVHYLNSNFRTNYSSLGPSVQGMKPASGNLSTAPSNPTSGGSSATTGGGTGNTDNSTAFDTGTAGAINKPVIQPTIGFNKIIKF